MTIPWAVASALVGVFAGLLGAFLQAVVWNSPVGQIPWGLALAMASLIVLIRGATWGSGARWAGWLLFTGWCLGTAAMAVESPSGDIALGEGARPLVYLILAAISGAFAATLPARRIRVTA